MPIKHHRHRPRRPAVRTPTGLPRHTLRSLLLFIGSVLLANALIGERGLVATHAARSDFAHLANEIDFLRSENARLRKVSSRLRTDPGSIEAIARNDLGLLRPGEFVFLLTERLSARGQVGINSAR